MVSFWITDFYFISFEGQQPYYPQNKTTVNHLLLANCKNFKSKYLIVFLFFLTPFVGFSQGPGSPYVDAGEDVSLDCSEDCIELNAQFMETGETTEYEVTPIPYDPPFSFSMGGGIVTDGYIYDDWWGDILDLSFDFEFFGQEYNQMMVGTNGLITFDLVNNTPRGFCEWYFEEDDILPSPDLFLSTIFGPYTDVEINKGGDITWFVSGTAPYRTVVVNTNEVPLFACEADLVTSQIVLYETTNIIEVYIKSRPSGCIWIGGLAILGIQNEDGTQAYTPPGRNTGDWEAIEEAWRFTPSGESNVEFAWLDESGAIIGNNKSITVCPENMPTTYTARAIWTSNNGNTVTLTDEVTVYEACPFNVGATDITDFGATISWERTPNATGNFTVDVYQSGANPDTDPAVFTETVDESVNSVEVTGLEIDTTYDGYVTRECNNGGSARSERITFTTGSIVGIDDFEFTNLTVYPNPTKSSLHLSASKVIEDIQVYNMLGQKILTTTPNTSDATIDVSRLAIGTYILRVTIDGVVNTKKLIKE